MSKLYEVRQKGLNGVVLSWFSVFGEEYDKRRKEKYETQGFVVTVTYL